MASETDRAVEDLERKYQGVYGGVFNLTMNVLPGNDTSRTTRGRTSCATEDSQPEMALSFWLSSSHYLVDVDDRIAFRATVFDVRAGLHVMWIKCES